MRHGAESIDMKMGSETLSTLSTEDDLQQESSRKNNMTDGLVRKWVRAIKEGHMNVHAEERSGESSLI